MSLTAANGYLSIIGKHSPSQPIYSAYQKLSISGDRLLARISGRFSN
jgi:hypothetical protein